VITCPENPQINIRQNAYPVKVEQQAAIGQAQNLTGGFTIDLTIHH
jgi:hypothetical protein